MKLALCLPGNSFNGTFVDCYGQFIVEAMSQKIELLVSRVGGSNIYHLRDNLLMGSAHFGPYQTPFQCLKKPFDYDYVLFIDSDMVFTFQDFVRLESRKKDVILGLFKLGNGFQYSCGKWSVSALVSGKGLPFYTKDTLPSETALFQTDIGGFAFTLVKKGVFEKIRYPWFSEPYTYLINETVCTAGEDIGFLMKAKAAGFEVWVDPTVRIGHEKLVTMN